MKKNIKAINMVNEGQYILFEKGQDINDILSYMKRHEVAGLSVHDAFDPIENLGEVLSEYVFFKRLHISTVHDQDWHFLNNFKQLTHLSINTIGKNVIDFSGMRQLNTLTIPWRPNIQGLATLTNLERLCLVSFKEKSLIFLSCLPQLSSLMLKTSSIQTLQGIENCKKLEYLELGNCRYLQSIRSINGFQFLNRIEIDACSKIDDYEYLDDLPQLNCLIMMNCKSIKSIKFLNNFKSLRYVALTGNTSIVDGDLEPLAGIPEAFVAPRRHYRK